MPTVRENRYWDKYPWPRDGDEWSDQAAFCGGPYPVWKQGLVDSFIAPNVGKSSTVLEIGPGHERWAPFLAERARRYIGVDMNPSCIAYCRNRFSSLTSAEFQTNDGRSLPTIFRDSINFVWSFDSFVNIDPVTTDRYMAAFARILAHGGRCCIHHPGRPDEQQRERGWRSAVTADSFASMAHDHGLRVLSQGDSWGPDQHCNTRLNGDCISTLEKP